MSTTKTTTVTVLALAAALALTGCSSTPKATPTQDQSATGTATQTATAPTSTPTPTLTAGVKVTNTGGTFIEDLKKGLAPGLHLIRLGDTLEYMVVDEHQPLPAEVLDPVVAQVKAGYPAPGAPNGDALAAAETAVGDLQVSAGKCVVLYQGPASVGAYGPGMADPQSPLGSAGQPLFKEYGKVFNANRPKSLDEMIAQFTPFAERAGCTADRLVFIQFTN
jgi:hypothetical protein